MCFRYTKLSYDSLAGPNINMKRLLFVVFLPFLLMVSAALLAAYVFVSRNNESLWHLIPYALLFTGFRETTILAWNVFGTPLDTSKVYEHELLPEIPSSEYSYEKLRLLTKDFTSPAVVRGLFSDTPALTKWKQPGYLSGILGEFEIPIIHDAEYGTTQVNRTFEKMGPYLEDVITEKNEKAPYLFFPMKSRIAEMFRTRVSHNTEEMDGEAMYARLSTACNKLAIDDLKIDERIRPGFGHLDSSPDYIGTQLIIGKGGKTFKDTTGTAWHCAMGSNYFVQIAGRKRWYYMDPKYSYLFKPLRNGNAAFMLNTELMPFMKEENPNHKEFNSHFPFRYTDLSPGDMLYNPPFQWHTIQNYPGLSMGTPIREKVVKLSFQQNFVFASVVLWNKLMDRFGVDIGGFPESGNKEHD